MRRSCNFVSVIRVLFLICYGIRVCGASPETSPEVLKRKFSDRSSSTFHDLNNGSTPPGKIRKKILFWSGPVPKPAPPPPRDYNMNPPDLFTCAEKNHPDRSKIPENILKFAEIFKKYNAALSTGFKSVGEPDFEIIKWEECEIVNNVSQRVHLEFIIQFIENVTASNQSLLQEYIDYFFTHFKIIGEYPYYRFLLIATQKLRPFCVAKLLEYWPNDGISKNLIRSLWSQILNSFIEHQLGVFNYSDCSKWKSKWAIWEIIYMFTKRLSLTGCNWEELSEARSDELIKIHPILTGIARFDSSVIDEFLNLSLPVNLEFLCIALNNFIYLSSKDLMLLIPKERVESTADAVFRLLTYHGLSLRTILTFRRLSLAEFILFHSNEARKTIPVKELYTLIIECFDEDDDLTFVQGIWLTISFGKKLKTLMRKLEYEPPEFEKLKLLLKTFESFTVNDESIFKPFIDADAVISEGKEEEFFVVDWTPPSFDLVEATLLADDNYNSFLYEAGRMVLVLHFGIPYRFGYYSLNIGEPACFKDLAWYLEFHVNYDLRKRENGRKELKIRINDRLKEE